MPRYQLIACLAVVLSTSLAGCATPATPGSANIDYSQMRYEDTRFDKPGVAMPAQIISFKTDIDYCEGQAQKNYKEALAMSGKLSQIYGQSITPQVLQPTKHMQVLVCMAGNEQNGPGKGWKISK